MSIDEEGYEQNQNMAKQITNVYKSKQKFKCKFNILVVSMKTALL